MREHGWVFAAVVVCCAAGLFALLQKAGDQGGRFSALVRFVGFLGSVSAMVTANRLFAREYGGKTQLFLEVLPITRARVLATKWAIGAAFLGGLVTLAWVSTLVFMRRTEVITTSDALRALLATSAFTLALWSWSAMAGMLGRYRYVAWLVLLFFTIYLEQLASVPLRDAPVLRLLSEASAMARAPVSPRALLEVAVLVAGCGFVTAVLGLRGSGSMAAALAARMTARERAFVVAAVMVSIFVSVRLKEERELPAFELEEATRSTSTRGVVGVMTTVDVGEEAARALGEAVAGDVDSLATTLQLEKVPPVFILPQHGLMPTVIQRADLADSDGIVLRGAPDVEVAVLRARVMHELLKDLTESRALKEDRHALLDGFSVWWTARQDPVLRARWWRWAAASRVPLSEASVLRWFETSEQLGECIATALAFALVDTLAQTVGEERTVAMARALFSRPRSGLAAVLFEARPVALLREAGTDWGSLTAKAEARRREVEPGQTLATAKLALRAGEGGSQVVAQVTGASRWRVLYGNLGPWARGQDNLRRLDARGEQATLPLTLSRGERLLAVVEHDDPALGCPVRLEAVRLEAR